jgi:hypothetical protein
MMSVSSGALGMSFKPSKRVALKERTPASVNLRGTPIQIKVRGVS